MALFIVICVFVICSIIGTIQDTVSMSKPYRKTSTGFDVYLNRKSEEYIRGEKAIYSIVRDADGVIHECLVGKRTGTIYEDYTRNKYNKMLEYDKNQLEEHYKKNNYKAYLKYYPKYEKRLVTEISTNRIITCLYNDNINNKFYKYYLKEDAISYNDNEVNGIEITEDEYNKLNIPCAWCHKYPYNV